MVDNKYSEWRVLTPILLATITVLGGITAYFAMDKLNAMSDKSDKLFTIVGSIRSSFEDYKVTAEGRFTRIETELSDLPMKVKTQ